MGGKNLLTRHHIVPRSRGGSDDRDNIVMLKDSFHVAFHIVFDNLTPDEQLMKLVSLNETALRREFRSRVRKLLEKSSEWTYENGIFMP